MMKKHNHKKLTLGFLMLMIVLVAACGSPAQPAAPATDPEIETPSSEDELEDLPVFTLEELSDYDGQDDRPAYVAVDGLVYDFTELGRWTGGIHNGYQAGQDLTEELHNISPHGERVLSRAPVVGRLE